MVFGKTGSVVYRIRIFDNFHHIMTAEVRDKGQRYITATVHSEFFGLGEKTKLAFMISPDIKPFILKGHIYEINYDIRDSVPMGDLLDVAPNLIYEINGKYKLIAELRKGKEGFMKTGTEGNKEDPGVVDADFTVKADPDIDPLTDKVDPNKKQEDRGANDKRNIDPLIRGAKDAADLAAGLYKLKRNKGMETEDTLEKVLALCNAYPKLLYWLPKHLDLEPEIHFLVSQTKVDRVGIMPSYYIAQTGAMISEKTLTRPKEQTGWQDVAKLGVIVLGFVAIVGLVVYLLTA